MFQQILLCVVVFSILVITCQSAYCNGSPDPGIRTNDFPIFDSKPKFIRYSFILYININVFL